MRTNKKNMVMYIAGAVMVVAVICSVFYFRSRFKAIKNKAKTTTLAKEPALNSDTHKKEYEVDNSNTAAIFLAREAQEANKDTSGNIEENTQIEAVLPQPVESKPSAQSTAVTGKKSNQKRGKEKNISSATQQGQGNAKVNDNAGALAEMERREREATEAVRRDAHAQIEAERKKRENAERKAKELEEVMRKPKFNFTIVERRNEVDITAKNKQVTNQEKELLYSAKVYGTQTVKSGDPLTIRNTEDIVYGRNKISAGSILYGIANQSTNRLLVTLSSVMTREGKFSCNLAVCDFDMIKGIYLKDYEDVAQDNATDEVINEATGGTSISLIGSVTKTTAKQVSKNLNKKQKITITLEDGYEIYIAVPVK